MVKLDAVNSTIKLYKLNNNYRVTYFMSQGKINYPQVDFYVHGNLVNS